MTNRLCMIEKTLDGKTLAFGRVFSARHSDPRYLPRLKTDEMASARCFSKRGTFSSSRQSRRDGIWRNGLIQLSAEGWDSGDLLAEHEQVDVVRALIGLDALEVTHVPETLILVEDADRAQDVARGASGI